MENISLMRCSRKIQFIKVQGIALLSFFLVSCMTASIPEKLTKDEMLEDFDKMSEVLRDAYPTDTVNKKIYGIDFDKTLKTRREEISENKTPEEFSAFLNETLLCLKGSHLWQNDTLYQIRKYRFFLPKSYSRLYPELYADYVSEAAIDMNHQYYSAQYKNKNATIPLLYHQGNYYSKYDFTLKNVQYRRGMKLLEINDEKIKDILPKIQSNLDKYDSANRMFYGRAFKSNAGDNFYVYIQDNSQVQNFKFQDKDRIVDIPVADVEKVEYWKVRTAYFLKRMVTYFNDMQILYIRIPVMDPSDTAFYLERIKEETSGKHIRGVVLDIRCNSGGSDTVWTSILQAITGKEYHWKLKTAVKNTSLVKGYLRKHADFGKSLGFAYTGIENYHAQKIPFLDNEEYLVCEVEMALKPSADSLNLNVPIYIIAHDIYSSAGGLVAMANATNDNIITVGTENPIVLGKGIDPLFIGLKNSGFIFSLEPVLDITNCQSAEDTLHTKMKIEVPFSSPDDRIRYCNSSFGSPAIWYYLIGQYESRQASMIMDWLKNRDPYFRKVISLIDKTP